MKYCSFDLEIAKEIPEGADWEKERPFGISCAATFGTGETQPTLWYTGSRVDGVFHQQMSVADCRQLIRYLDAQLKMGYVPLTWNGLSFDFRVLAEESGMWTECAELAMSHVDMMFQLVCLLGYPVGLATCLAGHGLPGKAGMTGADAPRVWKSDPEAVLKYVAGDVTGPLALAEMVEREKGIAWTSKRGRPMAQSIGRWLTVRECLKLPEPDMSRMSFQPRPREAYCTWIGEAVAPTIGEQMDDLVNEGTVAE